MGGIQAGMIVEAEMQNDDGSIEWLRGQVQARARRTFPRAHIWIKQFMDLHRNTPAHAKEKAVRALVATTSFFYARALPFPPYALLCSAHAQT